MECGATRSRARAAAHTIDRVPCRCRRGVLRLPRCAAAAGASSGLGRLGGTPMQERPCAACRKKFTPDARAPEQRFCQEKRCQRERRRRWQKRKRRGDTDYRDNERRAQHSWAERHPEYWRAYRRQHPQYRERNRLKQRQRDERRRGARRPAEAAGVLANGDASRPILPLQSGTYELRPANPGSTRLANGDVWRVQIAVVSGG